MLCACAKTPCGTVRIDPAARPASVPRGRPDARPIIWSRGRESNPHMRICSPPHSHCVTPTAILDIWDAYKTLWQARGAPRPSLRLYQQSEMASRALQGHLRAFGRLRAPPRGDCGTDARVEGVRACRVPLARARRGVCRPASEEGGRRLALPRRHRLRDSLAPGGHGVRRAPGHGRTQPSGDGAPAGGVPRQGRRRARAVLARELHQGSASVDTEGGRHRSATPV